MPFSIRTVRHSWRCFGALGAVGALGAITAVVAGFASGCAHAPAASSTSAGESAPPAASVSTSAPATTRAIPPSAGPAAPKAPEERLVYDPQPPDGVWLEDEQGRQYFVETIPKQEGEYIRLSPTQIALRYGMRHEVVDEDDSTFSVKVYRVSSVPERPRFAQQEERKRAVPVGFDFTTTSGDRLELLPYSEGLPQAGQWRNGMEIADLDGDGHLDIVFAPSRKGSMRPNVFRGDGAGRWRQWREVRFPSLPYDYGDVAVADFDADGRLDIALAAHLRGLMVLVQRQPGEFVSWGEGLPFEVPGQDADASGFSSRALAAADWNGDGRSDLVALGEGPRMGGGRLRPARSFGLAIFLNQGDGTWLTREEASQGVTMFGEDLAVGDVNGDGRSDVVLATSVIGYKEVLRIGAADGSWTREELAPLRRAYVNAVTLGDFDADRRPDIAVGYVAIEGGGVFHTGVDLLLGREGGEWDRRTVLAKEGNDNIYALAGGDVDGDGKVDLVGLTGEGATWLLLGTGTGDFVLEESPELENPKLVGCRGFDAKLVDLDRDGVAELVAAFAGEPSALFTEPGCPDNGALTAWKARRRG